MTTALGIHINKGSWNFSMSMGSLAPSRKHKHPLTGIPLDHFLLVILNINKIILQVILFITTKPA